MAGMVHQCCGVGAESGHFLVPYDEHTPLPCLAVCIGMSDCRYRQGWCINVVVWALKVGIFGCHMTNAHLFPAWLFVLDCLTADIGRDGASM